LASSYRRRCRYCSRWISMRQMPAGQWVAFEGDGPHDCDRPQPRRVTTSPPRTPTHAPPATPEFEDFEMPPGAQSLASPDEQAVRTTASARTAPTKGPKRPPQGAEEPPIFDDFEITPIPVPVATAGTPVRANQSAPRERERQPASGDRMATAKLKPEAPINKRVIRHETTQATSSGADDTRPSSKPIRPAVRSSIGPETGGRKLLLAVAYLIISLYFAIGTLHSVYFSLFISRTDCIDPKNILVKTFCNTGMGISHFVTLLGWPLYYR
jgi:hypothetical protein